MTEVLPPKMPETLPRRIKFCSLLIASPGGLTPQIPVALDLKTLLPFQQSYHWDCELAA
jgi:hypothetical protein